uniref:Uncharacterized protein n=1 Tax=Arundo donax TaxID=35708 RepID=A0A0A9EHM4_ARUDO
MTAVQGMLGSQSRLAPLYSRQSVGASNYLAEQQLMAS